MYHSYVRFSSIVFSSFFSVVTSATDTGIVVPVTCASSTLSFTCNGVGVSTVIASDIVSFAFPALSTLNTCN